MSRLVAVGLLFACATTLLLARPAGIALATLKAERTAEAREFVQEALHREIYGLQADREQLLERALALVPDFAPAKWHRGYVWFQNEWMRAEEVSQWASRNRNLIGYQRLRDERPDTAAGHLAVANWCREHGLLDQERAHLTRVLDLEPDHRTARARLGFRRVAGRWVSEEARQQAAQQRGEQREALADWLPKIRSLSNQLRRRSEASREAAAESIRSIRDPRAIPALEAALSASSDDAARLVLDALSAMPEQEAVVSLARHAVLSPWQSVREAAAEQLKQRPLESFVPVLIAEMYTPLRSSTALVPGRRGGLAYRHMLTREGQEERQTLVMDTLYRRVAMPGGDARDTLLRSMLDSVGVAGQRQWSMTQRNMFTNIVNRRIAEALNTAADQQLPAAPEQWWQWWDDQNDVIQQGEKPTRMIQVSRQVDVADQVPFAPQDAGGFPQGLRTGGRQRAECFAAGTLVWCNTGTIPIERVRVGDLVLAQDIETGELAFKPVLRTTTRPAEPLATVQIGNETFRTTRGHLFWVSGRGWVKARDLQSGMQVHGLGGGHPVILVDDETDEEDETYNLVVGDFNTYFVGDERVMSHDVTSQRPTLAVVPGLTDR